MGEHRLRLRLGRYRGLREVGLNAPRPVSSCG